MSDNILVTACHCCESCIYLAAKHQSIIKAFHGPPLQLLAGKTVAYVHGADAEKIGSCCRCCTGVHTGCQVHACNFTLAVIDIAGFPAESDQGTTDNTRQAQPLSGKQSQQVLAYNRMQHPVRRHTFSAGDGLIQEPVQAVAQQAVPKQRGSMGFRTPRISQNA